MNFPETKITVCKILIVDDNADARRMTRLFLRDLSFEFEECADGADAVQCYEETRPDWVLMDWEMKRMNGLTATRRLVQAHPEARILMFTQHDDDALREAAIEAGARGFILKDDLLALREFLKEC